MTASVAVIGNLSFDRVDGAPSRPGGGPFHAARMLRALRRPAWVVARAAAQDRAALLPPLARFGIPVIWRDAQATARFAIDYEGDERRMVVDELGAPWTAPETVGLTAAWVHVAPLARSDFTPEVLRALAGGRRLSLDGQGLVRPPRTGPLELDADYDPEVLVHVSILKLAEDEVRALVGEPTESALRSFGVPEVVVTLGPGGSIVFADGTAERVRTHPVANVDTTGAGDAFAAAYLLGRSAGLSSVAAARWASGAVVALLAGRAT